ncbi:hypothetical protein SR187_1180 [Streptococcus ruminantium]|uniref:Uncharacterized protein n=1 Tax=Streptococcus ruminantium TaxID=1917441 RepID=A0A2Z5TKE4_9STRE|nr:hypothetical protein SR187_1180 [Streptococcus ruminantium]
MQAVQEIFCENINKHFHAFSYLLESFFIYFQAFLSCRKCFQMV